MASKGKKEEWTKIAKEKGFKGLSGYIIDCIEKAGSDELSCLIFSAIIIRATLEYRFMLNSSISFSFVIVGLVFCTYSTSLFNSIIMLPHLTI